jgi:hypothetical protein
MVNDKWEKEKGYNPRPDSEEVVISGVLKKLFLQLQFKSPLT